MSQKIDNLHARAIALKSTLDSLTAELAGVKSDLALAVHNETGKHSTSHGSFTISENNTYPPSAFAQALTGGQQRLCFKPRTLDPAKVKALYPAVYAAAKVTNGVKVTL